MLNRILNIVGWIGMGMVFAAVVIRFGFPAREEYARYLAWAGLVAVLLYTLGQWREIAKVFSRRQARYGTLAGTSVLLVLGILAAINYIGARQNKRWDLTANKQFTLSDQSRNVLGKLDSPLEVKVFAQEQDFPRYQDRLKEYTYASKQLATEYIDPDKKPTIAKQNQITQYGTIVLNYKGRTERVTSDNEQDITNGIIKVVSGQQRKVYFTQGHGEKDTTGSERDGYNAIAAALGRENYGVDKLVIAQQGSVPDDASVVVVAGPRTDFFAPEIEALKKYLEKAGKVFLMIDPPEKADSAPLTNLIALAHDWGMDVGNDVVVDVSGMGRLIGTDASVPVAANYPSHPITQRFQFLTAFPLARSITSVAGGVNSHIAQTFVESSPRSWAEADVKSLLASGQVSLDESKGDKKGPISLAAAVSAATTPAATPAKPDEGPKPETRVVVFGDSDFAANGGLGIQGNRDLFMNIVGWLSQQENLISIRPKEADDRRITLTATQQANINWLSLLIIPAAIFGTGVYSWWRRRYTMRGLRSTIILFVVAVSVGGYSYYLSKKPETADTSKKLDKVFDIASDKIEEIKITSVSGDATTLKKEGGTWKLTEPVAAGADESEVNGITNALATADVIRVVDENPSNLNDYGLSNPRIAIDFKASGDKDYRRLFLGEKTPTGSDLFAKRNDEKKVFLVSSFQESSLNKSTFDLRDKNVLTVDR